MGRVRPIEILRRAPELTSSEVATLYTHSRQWWIDRAVDLAARGEPIAHKPKCGQWVFDHEAIEEMRREEAELARQAKPKTFRDVFEAVLAEHKGRSTCS